MKPHWSLVAVLLLAGCGVTPAPPTPGGDAPTGVAPGTTLYFVDAQDRLQPQLRHTGRLGTIAEAEALLLAGPGGSGLHTQIAESAVTRVAVTVEPDVIRLTVPLSVGEVTPLGIDQLVCTALGVHVQSGGSPETKVRLAFTEPVAGSDAPRACPLIK